MRHKPWTPAVLPTRDVILIGAALLAQVVVRGIDYMRGIGDRAPEYAYLTEVYPIELVGATLFAAAATGLLGMAIRCHVMVWSGHYAVAAAYTIIAGTMLVSILADPQLGWDHYGTGGIAGAVGSLTLVAALATVLWVILRRIRRRITTTVTLIVTGVTIGAVVIIEAPVRAPGIFLVAALCHGLIALRTGPAPLADDEHNHIDEETVGPDDAGTAT